MTFCCGVDGFREGWIAVTEEDGSPAEVRPFASLAGMVEALGTASIIAIDIPIGLPDRGPRQCDVEARRLLGPKRGSSVFPAPRRPMLDADTYAIACEVGRKGSDGAISKQAWALMPKLREVDELLRQHPEVGGVVKEVHPEICFYHLAGEQPIVESKRTLLGLTTRLELLRVQFGDAVIAALNERPRLRCADDDVLDAFAALWTARRIARGTAVQIPRVEERDAIGLPMEMWA